MDNNTVPTNFRTSIVDFLNDLSVTFPEYTQLWSKWLDLDATDEDFQELYEYSATVYPERFFDILNQKVSIFSEDSEINTYFLPNVDFRMLYNCEGISERTKETIWKYLQVILLSLVNSIKDKMNFGDTMNMFDNLEEGDLHAKLQDAITNIGKFFEQTGTESTESTESTDNTKKTPGLPEMEELHGHLQSLFDGKIGQLAKELAEDMSEDITASFGEDMEGMNSTQDVLKKLMQNPQKIKNVVNTVKDKLASKMESGDISREDLMEEASEMMKKMNGLGGGGPGGGGGLADMFKNMGGGPGGGDMGNMFKTMAQTMGMNIPSGMRIDSNAINQVQQKTTVKERLKARAQAKNQDKIVKQLEEQAIIIQRQKEYDEFMLKNPNLFDTNDPNSLVYRLEGDKQEKSDITKKPSQSQGKNKNKKGKKSK